MTIFADPATHGFRPGTKAYMVRSDPRTGQRANGAQRIPVTITATGLWSVTAETAGAELVFLVAYDGVPFRDGGRLRLIPGTEG